MQQREKKQPAKNKKEQTNKTTKKKKKKKKKEPNREQKGLPANCYWALDGLHVTLLDQCLACLIAQILDLRF